MMDMKLLNGSVFDTSQKWSFCRKPFSAECDLFGTHKKTKDIHIKNDNGFVFDSWVCIWYISKSIILPKNLFH